MGSFRFRRPPLHGTNDATRPQAAGAESERVRLDRVIQAELIEIQKRRREAGLAARREDAEASEVRDDLVGLALSGGGIRSASFCLGFLQTLYHTGLLRHVDYISSVSGGGYAAASLASEVMNPETNLAWEDGGGSDAERRPGGASTGPGNQLVRSGAGAHSRRRGGPTRHPGPAAARSIRPGPR